MDGERVNDEDLFPSGEILGPDGEAFAVGESRFKALEGRASRG